MSTMEREGAGRREMSRVFRAREDLGHYWGLGRALNPIEMARALRLAGDNAPHDVLRYETGNKTLSGPASLALDLMSPPGAGEVETIARWVGEIRLEPQDTGPDAPPRDVTLFGLLYRCGYDPEAVLQQVVREAAEAFKEPPDLDEALGAPVSQRVQDKVGVYRTVRRVRRREARFEARRAGMRVG